MSGFENGRDQVDAWRWTKQHAPKNPTARMSVGKTASEYNMYHKKRGLAIVFNHLDFDDEGLETRVGTKVDAKNLDATLSDLRFEVKIYKDYKLKEIQNMIAKVAAIDHSDNDCLMIIILSHGESGLIWARDQLYDLDVVWSPFVADLCPTLAGKPKLFFVQACRGEKLDDGITLEKRTETDSLGDVPSYKIPTHADFLFAYSTIPGFYSWRNPQKGTWFIESLCLELKSNGKKHDILKLLTSVNQRVAEYESRTPKNPMMHKKMQISCFVSMLTRILWFHEKE